MIHRMKNEAALTRLGRSFSHRATLLPPAVSVRWAPRATMAVENTRPMKMKIQKGSTSFLKWLLPDFPHTHLRLR